jgi:Flp pilus assembly protein TadG
MGWRSFKSDESGSTMAEMAIVAGVFFMILIGIIEFSRLLYTHNALTDAARRGARYAAIHKQSAETCVRNVVIYGATHIDENNGCAPTGPPLINGIQTATININYSGADTNDDGIVDTSYGTNLGTVTVSIESYQFNFLIPYFKVQLNMPHYATTLPAESAGEEPDDIGATP